MDKQTENSSLVSIIIPVYNTGQFIQETLRSVMEQSYTEWECLCIDDCSTDDSISYISEFTQKDGRIRLLKMQKNGGAAAARNYGVSQAGGKYLAFLDSDDLWVRDKLEKQLRFMQKGNYPFSCTSYGKIDEESKVLDKVCICQKKYTYDDVLKRNPGNSTIIYDCQTVGKVYGPDIHRRNDLAMWLTVIKKTGCIYGYQEVLGYHRIRKDSLSINKRRLISYQWKVYRDIEKLSVMKSAYLIVYKVVQTMLGKNG